MDIREKVSIRHRLHFKIALFVILTIIIIFGLFYAYQIFSYRRMLTNMEIDSSEKLGRTLTSSLEIAMINSDISSIQYSISEVSRNEDIIRVFLLNMEGVVKASSEEEMIGLQLSKQSEGCGNCHDANMERSSSTAILLEAEDVLRVVTPIKNKPLCYSCHGDTESLNGVLILDHSLHAIKAEIVSNLKLAGGIALISVLVMMLLFRWYIKRQVINRIVYLESLARRVVNNESDLDIELEGRDELASLARSFHNMKTTLKLSMQRIDNHRNYLTHLLENLTDGILIIDDAGQAAFVNKSFYDVLELNRSAMRTGDVVNFNKSPLDSFLPIGRLIASAQNGETIIKEVIRLRFSEKRHKHLDIHIGTLVLPPWLKPEIIVVIRDITARMMFENQVYQAEKLSTIGRLAAGIAHEINNPMASILTCAEGLLKSEPEAQNDNIEYLNIIKNSARRCKIITQKLLDYSAVSSMKMEIINLGEVLQEAVSLLQFEATSKQIKLNINKPDEIPAVRGCKDSLLQVFVNLILNGIQAVDKGGVVNIEACVKDNSVDIIVADNGSGISDENLAHLFDPFFTTKPVGVGTGLGLSVSQGIVKQHDGKLRIVQGKIGFTSFLVSLPLVKEKENIKNDKE